MNSRSRKRLLSILVCVAMIMTQMVPLSFADTAPADGAAAAGDVYAAEPVSGDAGSSAASDEDGQAADVSVSDIESAGGEAAVQDGEGEAPVEEDINPQLSWYLNDTKATVFEISNAEQMYGLAKLVNGVAKANVKNESTGEITESTTVTKEQFANKTIKLVNDIDLSEVTDEQWVRIGYSTTYAFKGTFDGCGHTISGLSVVDVPADTYTVYAGLFGYISGATVKDFDLQGEVALTVAGTKRGTTNKDIYAGPVAAYARDSSTVSGINVDMEYTGECVNKYIYLGGVVGYSLGTTTKPSYITDCTVKGSYAMDTEAYAPTSLSTTFQNVVGGIAGYTEYTVVENCTSDLDITSYARSIGGIVGYMKGSNSKIIDCVNNGDLKSLGAYGDDYIGGIAGCYADTAVKSDKTFANLVNNGDIQATSTWYVRSSAKYANFYAGGIAGYADRLNAANVLNTGTLIIPDNTGSSKVWAAGVIGAQINASLENGVTLGNMIYKSYTVGEEDAVSQISNIGVSSTAKSVLKNCFAAENKGDAIAAVSMAENENAEVASVGIIKKNNAVSACSSEWPLLYGAKTLSQALNTYVIKNGGDELRSWVSDDGVYQPFGSAVESPAKPSSEMLVKTSGDADFTNATSASDAAGNSITLKAKVSVDKNSSGESELSYQWYVSSTPGSAGAQALEGENASGVIEGLSGEITYTATSEEYSQLYYFVRVTNTVTYYDPENGEYITEDSAYSDSAKTELTFTKDQTGFNGEMADAFESGDGTPADPYIIANAAQLKRMEVLVNSTDADNKLFRTYSYKLSGDIDYRNVSWTPMGGTASTTAFTGTFDGAGYTIKNIRIVADGKAAGLFSFVSAAKIKNLTLTGNMYAANTKYAGGFVGYSMGASEFGDLTNGMNVTADNVQNVGGIIGWVSGGPDIYNCVNAGDIYMTADPAATAIYGTSGTGYAAGVMGYTSSFAKIYNCENTGDVTAAKASGAQGTANLYAAGIFCAGTSGTGLNDVNYGNVKTIGSSAANNCSGIRTGGSGNNLNCFDILDGDIDNDTALEVLNDFVIERITWVTYQNGNTWVVEDGKVYPHGPRLTAPAEPVVTLSAKIGDGEFTKTNDAIEASCDKTVTLKASVSVNANKVGKSTVTYQWYKMDSADGAGKTAMSGAGSSGTLAELKGDIELALASENYSDAYYTVEIVNTVSYANAGADVEVAASATGEALHVIFKKGDGSYEGEVSESLAGSGTEAEPYLIKSAADLQLMQQKVNANEGNYAGAYYQLENDIDFNNIKLTATGKKTVPFKGTFNGAGHKISNVKISAVKDGTQGYTGIFGYMDSATVKDLTVEGSIDVDGTSQFTGSIAGQAVSSKLINCKADVDMTLEKTTVSSSTSYTGGLIGIMDKSSVENCANLGDITVTSVNASGIAKIGGIVGTLTGNITSNGAKPASNWAADRSIYNSYNSGNIKIVTANEESTRAFNVGGIAAEITSAAVVNSANTGDITSVGCNGVSGAHNIGGIAYSLATGSSGAVDIRNCASFGKITADTSNVSIYTGIAVIPNRASSTSYGAGGRVNYLYAPDNYGLDNVFGVAASVASYVMDQTGIGVIDDETGNITNISVFNKKATEAAASDYVRTDGVRKTLNGEGKTDAYYALNAWTGMNTTDAEKYNSWTAVEGKAGAYVPAGEAKVSPFASDTAKITVTLSGDAYKDKVFGVDDTLPEMTATVTGADSSATLNYSWYKSKNADGSGRTLIADAANSASYTPKADPGKYYYSVDVTIVNGEYFKNASSDPVGVTTKSDTWNGDSASIGTLTGYGTKDDPYIIDTPEKLALISSAFETYYTAKPPVTSTDAGKTATAFGTAYFKITADLDMDGSYAFKCIGTSSKPFKGHLYGEKENGGIPVIKNLYINAPVTSSSYAGLFASISAGGSVEDLVFENARVDINTTSTMNMGVVAGTISGTSATVQSAIRNVTVSGDVKVTTGASAVTMGGIVGTAGAWAVIEDCVNNAEITADGTSSSANVSAGGIAGKVSYITKNCLNNGKVTGLDKSTSCGTAGIAGYALKSGTCPLQFTGCKNTADITGYKNVGGIIGYFNWGSADNCYNTGHITTANVPTSSTSSGNVGGIAGNMTSYQVATAVSITSCYNAGVVTDEAAGAAYENRAGLIAGYGSAMVIDRCYALPQGDLDIYHSRSNSGTFEVSAEIVDRAALETTEAAANLGGLFYKLDNSAPVLEWEVAEADRCTLTVAAASDAPAKAYIKANGKKVNSVNVVKGSTADLELISDLGYKITSLKNGETEIVPVNGVYTVKPEASATLVAGVASTPETVAFMTDYNGTGEGQLMLVYRNTDGIGEGNGVFFGNIQLIHASAFDKTGLVESATAAGFVSPATAPLATAIDTYIAFVDDSTSISDVAITLKPVDKAAAVDYESCDILDDGAVDIFDAQRVWDIMTGKDGLKATDMQRLHADINGDGVVNVTDVLLVHEGILKNLI